MHMNIYIPFHINNSINIYNSIYINNSINTNTNNSRCLQSCVHIYLNKAYVFKYCFVSLVYLCYLSLADTVDERALSLILP